jgi:hypothetical protein
MLFKNLFLIPYQEYDILQILHFLFVNSLFEQKFIITDIELSPSSSSSPQIHLFSIENELFYSTLPAHWSIQFVKKEDIQNQCPYYQYHLLLQFIEKIKTYAFQRHYFETMNKLYKLFHILWNEFDFRCSYCEQYQKEVEQFKEYPYFHYFYTSISESSFDELPAILNIYKTNFQPIQKQLRSEKLIQQLMFKFSQLFHSSFDSFLQDPNHIVKIKETLKKDVETHFIKSIPFLNLSSIRFTEWIDSLFLLKLNLKEFDMSSKSLFLFIKKIVFLLSFLFPEKINSNIQPTIYLNYQMISFSSISEMYDYHPLLRGQYFSKHLKMYDYHPLLRGQYFSKHLSSSKKNSF